MTSGQKWLKIVVSDHYLGNRLFNPLQTYTQLGECSELICFWATFFGQILGPLMAKNWLETFFNHYLEYWSLNLFQTWCTNWLREFSEMIGFGRIGQILALRWPSLYIHSFLIRHQAGMCILRFLRIIPHGILFIFPYSRYQAQMALQKQQSANKLATSARKRQKLEVRLL